MFHCLDVFSLGLFSLGLNGTEPQYSSFSSPQFGGMGWNWCSFYFIITKLPFYPLNLNITSLRLIAVAEILKSSLCLLCSVCSMVSSLPSLFLLPLCKVSPCSAPP